jgi:hypothetical protein
MEFDLGQKRRPQVIQESGTLRGTKAAPQSLRTWLTTALMNLPKLFDLPPRNPATLSTHPRAMKADDPPETALTTVWHVGRHPYRSARRTPLSWAASIDHRGMQVGVDRIQQQDCFASFSQGFAWEPQC